MKKNGYPLLLFILFFFISCDDKQEGNNDEEATNKNAFQYSNNEVFEYLNEAVDSLSIGIDLPKIDEAQFAEELYLFYKGRSFNPSWNYHSATGLIDILENIYTEGLNPESFPIDTIEDLLNTVLNEDDPEAGAQLDVLLSASYMKMADFIATGKIKADMVGETWHITPKTTDSLYIHLNHAVDGDLLSTIEYFRPRFSQYDKLRSFIPTYRKLVANGGWPKINIENPIQPGDSNDHIKTLREFLFTTGDYTIPPAEWVNATLYDSSLVVAVKRFQERHGLSVTDHISKRTLSVMNITAEERLKQIMLNMDRIRWFASGDMPETYVLVNIPEYTLRVFDNDQMIKEMKVVVGKVMNTTPIFSDMIEYAVFSPYWNVPQSIAEEEIWPVAKKDSTYLERNHYEVLDGWGPNANIIPYEEIHWHSLNDYRIRQKPGPWNALGRVKFMFPNDFAIYLHDTPARDLFNQSQRAFSHGCIRIEEPDWFADWLFPQYDLQAVQQKMNNRKREVIGLKNKVPVYIFYLTAFVDDKGRINFREDLYSLDKKLIKQFETILQ